MTTYEDSLRRIYAALRAPWPVTRYRDICEATLRAGRLQLAIRRRNDPAQARRRGMIPPRRVLIQRRRATVAPVLSVMLSLRSQPQATITPGLLSVAASLLSIAAKNRVILETRDPGPRDVRLIGDPSFGGPGARIPEVSSIVSGGTASFTIAYPSGAEPLVGPVGLIRVYGRLGSPLKGLAARVERASGEIRVRLLIDSPGPVGLVGGIAWIDAGWTVWASPLGPHVVGGGAGGWNAEATFLLAGGAIRLRLPGVPGVLGCPILRLRGDARYATKEISLVPSATCSGRPGIIVVPGPYEILFRRRPASIGLEGNEPYRVLAALYAVALLRAGREPGPGGVLVVNFDGPWLYGGGCQADSGFVEGVLARALGMEGAGSLEDIVEGLSGPEGVLPEEWARRSPGA